MVHRVLKREKKSFLKRDSCKAARFFKIWEGIAVRLDIICKTDYHGQFRHACAACVVILNGGEDIGIVNAIQRTCKEHAGK